MRAEAKDLLAKLRTKDKQSIDRIKENKKVKKTVLERCRFGGGCIKDTLIHLATSEMPFGGVGESGMGGYHGEAGFAEFTHKRSIVDKKTWMDFPIRYQPYTAKKLKLIRKFLYSIPYKG